MLHRAVVGIRGIGGIRSLHHRPAATPFASGSPSAHVPAAVCAWGVHNVWGQVAPTSVPVWHNNALARMPRLHVHVRDIPPPQTIRTFSLLSAVASERKVGVGRDSKGNRAKPQHPAPGSLGNTDMVVEHRGFWFSHEMETRRCQKTGLRHVVGIYDYSTEFDVRNNGFFAIGVIVILNLVVFLLWRKAIEDEEREWLQLYKSRLDAGVSVEEEDYVMDLTNISINNPLSELYTTMQDNFTCSYESVKQGRWYVLVTSAFSHKSGSHFFWNMLPIISLGPPCVWLVGRVWFLTFYFAGVFTSNLLSISSQIHKGSDDFAPHFLELGRRLIGGMRGTVRNFLLSLPDSRIFKREPPEIDGNEVAHSIEELETASKKQNRADANGTTGWDWTTNQSLGASGGVLALMWTHACCFPWQRLYLALLRFGKAAPSIALAGSYTFIDVLAFNDMDGIDHGAHLGGAVAGVLFYVLAARRIKLRAFRPRSLPYVRHQPPSLGMLWSKLRGSGGGGAAHVKPSGSAKRPTSPGSLWNRVQEPTER